MKKMTQINLLIMLIFILAACNTNDNETNRTNADSGPQSADSTKPYVQGVENVDVLNTHGSIEGLERMHSFYDNMRNGVPSDLRIVHYTTEGDPMITDLTYNGKLLKVKDDTTRDKYGSGEIRTNSCSNMIEEVNPTNTSYIAVDCNSGHFGKEEILKISYNMNQQDLFEFELKYGVNLENEVITKPITTEKENSTIETNVKGDSVVAASVKQEVYKRLVFANYLAEKDLETTCASKESMNYYLKVYINGGQREFRWSECDQSLEGLKFTEIAEYIIKQSEKKQTEKSEVTVQGYVLQVKDDTLLIGEGLNMIDYEWLKDEIQQMDLDAYIFDFTILEGVNTKEFNPGDKIQATIEGSIRGSKPGRAKVKDIKKLVFSNEIESR
ncbi:hypothetical protein T458_00025 [Brevibacillus panacihumi W25]|uniref:DUF4362 domain-containing protein n=1 Tax=Brevibacillus panacihumi W25 TaxID=1408254 RepID=V6MMI0_9BACL|nr:DUF4362 domain-containing protein [Brevibacillus panacihumi]EST56703.1 hypothetical protein T458_00025 [Brevibacillus panacihumi W25]